MNFTGFKEHLEKAFATAERFTGKNINLPILNNVLIESHELGLTVSATNLEYGVQISIPGTSKHHGKASVPAKIVSALMQTIKNDKIQISEEKGVLHVNTDGRDVKINGMPHDEFPLLPKIKKNFYFVIQASKLSLALAHTIPAVSLSEFKPELNGVYFKISGNTARFAATDTFRLVEQVQDIERKSGDASVSFILPIKSAQEVSRVFSGYNGEVEIAIGENQIEFNGNNIIVVSRLIEGVFPEYASIIPKNFETSAFISRQKLLETIRSSSLFASKLQDVTLELDSNMLEVRSGNADIGDYKNKFSCAMTGKQNIISFNYRYLLDGIALFEEEDLFIGVNSENTPSLFRNKSDGSLFYILMPIRVS